MAYIWTENEKAFSLAGVDFYHTYDNDIAEDGMNDYYFSPSPYSRETSDEVFDIRDLGDEDLSPSEAEAARAAYYEAGGDEISKSLGLTAESLMRLAHAVLRGKITQDPE